MPFIVRGKSFKVSQLPKTTYVRTGSGKIGHKATCPAAKRAKTVAIWAWANELGLQPDQLAERLEEEGTPTRLCKMCCSE